MDLITIDFELIEHAMRDLSRDSDDYYFNTQTGSLFVLSRQMVRALVSGSREAEQALPTWETRWLPLAREIVLGGSTNYVRVPEAFGCPEHRWMADFAKNLRATKLRQKLLLAMRGRGCCERFKEILKPFLPEWQLWRTYRSQQWEKKIQQWLENLGVLAINQSPRRNRAAA